MALHSSHSWKFTVPQSIYAVPKSACSGYCSSSLTTCSGIRGRWLGFRLVHQSRNFESCNFEGRRIRRFCTADFDEFSTDELSKEFEEFTQDLIFCEDENDNSSTKESAYAVSGVNNAWEGVNSRNMCSLRPFSLLNVEMLEPRLLGIRPEIPEWPERDEIVRISIERKANGDIPLSLRIIKKKRQWQEGFVDAGEFAYCSVKKAFSSMVFIIRELQTYALDIRQGLYCEDLQVIMLKVQKEMNASFVWLFQQVFSRTPTFMVYVMILLANFTVHSMADNIVIAAVSSPKMIGGSGTVSMLEQTNQERTLESAVSLPDVSDVGLVGNQGMALEDVRLWKSLVQAASRIQGDSKFKNFASPVTVEIEPDDYEEYSRMDLLYQMSLAQDPNNPLLLSNYGQFLRLVAHDQDRAEKCFERAILLEPPDAEALCLYADFLWVVRKDSCAAEERYQQAIEADPNNPHYISKYANFLWGTGNEEVCFPLNPSSEES